MAWSVEIDGVDLTPGDDSFPNVKAGTLSITWVLRGRSVCEFTVQTLDAYLPEVGAPVTVSNGGLLFGGKVFGSTREKVIGTIDLRLIHVRCVDQNIILDRLVTGQYQWYDTPAGTIIEDIVNRSMIGEGVDTSLIELGPTIERFETDYSTVEEAMEAIARIAKFYKYLDFEMKLRFFSPTSYTAPFAIGESPDNVESLTIEPSLDEYANRVIVRFPQFVKEPETEIFDSTGRHGITDLEPSWATDGTRTIFPLSFPVGAAPIISVNGVFQTVGVNGVDTGYDWYWQQGSNDIEQDVGGTVLTAIDVLEVTYSGVDATVKSVSNTTEIDARATIEGGTGIYVRVFEIQGFYGNAQAEQLANSLLDVYDDIPKTAQFETNSFIEPDIASLKPGDLINIGVSGYGSAADFLVRTIRFQDRPGTQVIWASVDAAYGPIVEDAADFFKRLAGSSSAASTLSGGGSSTGDEEVLIEY